MAKARASLSDILNELCPNVYFQPPGGHKLQYPCIIYSLSNISTRPANNKPYILNDKYDVTYITRDPDDEVKRTIASLPMCSMSRSFTSDNLHHYSYTLFY